MKSVKKFLQNILLVIELTIYVAYFHFEKLVFVGIIAFDQYTKHYIINSMILGESKTIIAQTLYFTYVQNPGAAFGILPYQRWFFVIAAVALFVFVIVYHHKLKNINLTMRYGGIITAAGATANTIDRLGQGVVVDFIDIKHGFPVFNIADIAIVVGMFVMIYVVIFQAEKVGKIEEVR